MIIIVITKQDLIKIYKIAENLKVKRIITTEKDAVKVAELGVPNEKLWVAELAPKLSLRVKNFSKKILSFCH